MKVLASFKVFPNVRGVFFGLLLVLTGFSSVRTSEAAMTAIPVKLAWAPSPDATVIGYRLYYGLANWPATNSINVGVSPTVTVSDLSANASYHFYVVSYNIAGLESLPSNSLTYSPPAMSRLALNKLANGTVQIQFRTAPGAICRVQYAATPNSSQWQTLVSATADLNGNIVVNDPPAGRPAIRFYRAIRP